MQKKIIDVTCGAKTMWFDKAEKHTVYCDKRRAEYDSDYRSQKHISIDPDIQCDFTDLPFPDDSFQLVVFDPPHVETLKESSWIAKKYGVLPDDWKQVIHDGFAECWRVCKPDGVIIFKWSDISISTRDVIDAIGHEPLFGHRSGKKMNTHWMSFMKFAEEAEDDE